jgi:nucleoside-diphosphate-sugar epimerase
MMSNDKTITVLVTGAAGHLGSHLVPMLVEDGFAVRGLDMRAPSERLPDACAFTQADLSDREAVRKALDGVALIVHTASIHPWKKYTDDQYLDANVKGTWHLYTVAKEMGIDRIVLTSSIAAMGYPRGSMDRCPLGEDARFPLSDLYCVTKHTQETIARMFAENGWVRTFALRPPAFMPRPERDTCFALTGPFAVVSDMASAHLAAVHVMVGRREPGGPVEAFEVFNTTNRLPYTARDYRDAGNDPLNLVKKHWPEAWEWLVANGYRGPWMAASYDISKAERILGWRPRFNFEDACAALRAT